ncbi:amino acid adenylation domain protein [Actinoplanes sp. N902-109]|nr:amino acid adenylation domain protein [Actinoplanes sp. N902-109]
MQFGGMPRNAVEALLRAARERPEAGVVTINPDGGGSFLSYPDLLDRARRLLGGLRGHGVCPGDHVILRDLAPADFFAAFWGCLIGGIRPVAVAGARDTAARTRDTWHLLDRPLVVGAAADGPAAVAVADLAAAEPAAVEHQPGEDDVAMLMLSSGSTGAAKAARITHRALAEFAAGSAGEMGLRPGDSTLNWLPLDHSGAFFLYHLLPVFAGCTNVHAPTDYVLADPLRWLDLMSARRIAHSWAPMFGYRLVIRAVADGDGRGWDLSALRSLVSGGEQIVPEAVSAFLTAVAPYGVVPESFRPCWGMAETVTAITWGRFIDPGGVRHVLRASLGGDITWAAAGTPAEDVTSLVAVGRPAAGAALRIVDRAGAALPERRAGRLQVRSKRITTGYEHNPEATAQALTADGWLETGDLGFLVDGALVVTGRAKDILIINGQNHSCAEIEAVAGAVPGVTPGAVGAAGIPDAQSGSERLAIGFAVADPADRPAHESTARAIRAALFRVLHLSDVQVTPIPAADFPRTGSGKVRRGELVRMLARTGRVPALSAVREVVAEVLGRTPGADVPFFDLGLTSVALARIRAGLELRLGAPVAATACYEHPTINALAAHLDEPGGAVRARGLAEPAAGPARGIAVIGMAARFPGAADLDQFWDDLREGRNRVTDLGRGAPEDPELRRVAGMLDDVDAFDAGFFGISAKEADLIDAGHRLFLQCCYHALEQGGYAGDTGAARVGVFAGSGMHLYGHQDPAPGGAGTLHAATGTLPDFLATRVAHRLGLTGPAIGVQTACSTSLVAVHLAVQALLQGDADLALAGAAAVRVPQEAGYRYVPGSILSESGRCRPFDIAADGTVGGNGVAAVLLKPLDRALADGDTIHAVIIGSAVNNDGRAKAGFTAPGADGHTAVVREALRRASVPADSISYLEAHGTATPVGDAVEFQALARAMGADTGRTGFCSLGSVKGTIGHLDTCAGMAGLLKTILMLRHRELVATVGLTEPNPGFGWARSPFVPAVERRAWTSPGGPRRAGVSALGVGGTNAHVILEEAPPVVRPGPDSGAVVLALSAADPDSLAELTSRLAADLDTHADRPVADVAATLALGRPHLPYRRAVPGRTNSELAAALRTGTTAGRPARERPLVFVFSGQGNAWLGMGARLYADFPEARLLLDEGERFFRTEFSQSLLTGLLAPASPGKDTQWPAATVQPALFALQAAQFRAWSALGVRPAAVVGHSVGEFAALYAAGALSFADGLALTAERGRLMQATAPGGMLAVTAPAGDVARLAAMTGLEYAAANTADHHVLAGREDTVRRAEALLDREGVPCRRLAVDRAFHTSLMDPVPAALRRHLDRITLRPLDRMLVTAADAVAHATGTTPSPDDLSAQARRPVDFAGSLAVLHAAGHDTFVELGPGRVLSRLGRQALPESFWTASQPGPDGDALWPALAELYERGVDPEWTAVARQGRRTPLPAYPFRRTRFAVPAPPAVVAAPAAAVTPPAAAVTPPAAAVTPPAAAVATPAASPDAGEDRVLRRIAELTAPWLGDRPAAFDPARTFLEQGGDSLTMMAIARDLGAEFGVPVALRDLVERTDTPRKLAQRIVASAPASPPVEVTAPAVPDGPAPHVPVADQERLDRQLARLEHLVGRMEALTDRPIESSAPARVTGTAAPAATTQGCDFSLYFFGDYPDDAERDKYRLIQEAARFADDHGFHTLWLPERHFDSFGALFPNPSVLAAALAAQTSRIRLHAGSVVLPLHQPLRVAEEWSVVDNISHGRAGLCVASGWHANDFVLAPDNFGRHRELMYENLHTLRQLWSGEPMQARSGSGEQVDVRVYPRPVQEQPPLFAAVLANPDSYRRAAEAGLGVVTNLMTQSIDDLAANIALYRRTRQEHGLDPATGRVVVLVHTYLAADHDAARRTAYEPFCAYLRSSLTLLNSVTTSLGVDVDLAAADPDDVEFLLEQAFARYCEDRALIGSVAGCTPVLRGLLAAGVDEVACFVDFGVATDRVLAGLTELDELRRRHLPSAVPAGTGRPEPHQHPASAMSPAQRRIWFLEQLHPGRTSYHEAKSIRFDGPLDVAALRGALERVVRRHPALRSVVTEDGEPRLRVLEHCTIACPLVDRTATDEETAVKELLTGELAAPLNLTTGPLVRAALLRLAPDRHVLLLVAHHIVFDSLSTRIFTRDLAACYRAWPGEATDLPVLLPPAGPTPGAPAADDPGAALRYWTDRLSGAPELHLPTELAAQQRSEGRGAHLARGWSAELAGLARAVGAEHRATVFAVMLGAVAVALWRLSGQDDFVLGAALTRRPGDRQNDIGMYVDTFPLRVGIEENLTFGAFAHRLGACVMAAYQYGAVPFEDVVAALNPARDPGRNPLFQVAVEFESAADDTAFAPALTATPMDLPKDRVPIELTLHLSHGGAGMRCLAEYDADRYDDASVRRLLDYVDLALRHALSDPDVTLRGLPALTEADSVLTAAAAGPPAYPFPGGLHELILDRARRRPDAVALVHGTAETTYRDLDARSERAALRLRARGVTHGDLVAVCLPRGADLIVWLLAILRSGAAYLPVDFALPCARKDFLLADSGAVLLVTGEREPGWPARVPVIDVDDDGPDDPGPLAPVAVAPDDLAYCIYTSGSTGRPKGVDVPHRGPVNLVLWDLAERGPQDTLQWSSPSFDGSVMEIFTTLAGGARLVLVDDDVRYDPAAVAEVIRRDRVARLFMPFTPLKYLMETHPVLPSLRTLVSAGERTGSTPALVDFLVAHPSCTLVNMYGPTEGSVAATAYRVEPGDTQPPVGSPVAGTTIRLLGRDGRPVPIGTPGEIHLAGTGVARGYRNRPDETGAAFLPDPERPGTLMYRTGDLARRRADGLLVYLGRADDQVKIRGHRIEPGEVQRVLLTLPGIRDAAVAARPGTDGEPRLVAWVVPHDRTDGWDPAALGEAAARFLPSYLVPARWVRLDVLPVTPNGKLDRDRLPEPPEPDTIGHPPTSDLEKRLHDLWREELGCPAFDVTRTFFDLGGHSLSAVRLLHRVAEDLGRELSLKDFFQAPTVRSVAARLAAAHTVPLTSAQRRMWRRHQAHGRPEVHTMGLRVDLTGPLDHLALATALNEVVRRHDALRIRVVHRDGVPQQEIVAPFHLDVPVTELPKDEQVVQRWCAEQTGAAFALDRAPLLRVRVARLAEEQWVLVFAAHHIIGDGWSLHLLWQEISELYSAQVTGRTPAPAPPSRQFSEYARREHTELQGDRRRALEAYWRELLAGAELDAALPGNRPRPARLSGRGAVHRCHIGAHTTAGLRAVAEEAGASLPTVLAARCGLWLSRLCGRQTVVLALSSARRSHPGDETVVGYLGEAVPVRIDVAEAADFAQLVRHTGERLYSALDHEALPLADIWQAADPGRPALLAPDIMVTVMSGPAPQVRMAGLVAQVTPVAAPGVARTGLYVVLTPAATGVDVAIEYSTDLFTEETVASWAAELAELG